MRYLLEFPGLMAGLGSRVIDAKPLMPFGLIEKADVSTFFTVKAARDRLDRMTGATLARAAD